MMSQVYSALMTLAQWRIACSRYESHITSTSISNANMYPILHLYSTVFKSKLPKSSDVSTTVLYARLHLAPHLESCQKEASQTGGVMQNNQVIFCAYDTIWYVLWLHELLANVFFSFSQQEDKNDVVFLQEVWLKKDYDTLRKCTMTRFYASPFDKECSRLNKARNQKAPQFEIMTE